MKSRSGFSCASESVADVNIEIEEIKASLAQQTESGHWTDLLRRQVRPALVVGLGLAIFQQITGINTVIYYAPRILQSAGFNSASGAILATMGVGVVNVGMTIVAMFLVDRAGRRPLLLVGIAGMIITLGMLGLSFRISNPSGQLAWISVICLMGYVASFAISLGPDLLAFDCRDLSAKNSWPRRGHCGDVQLGLEPDCLAYFFDVGRESRCEFNISPLCVASVASWLFAYCFVPETKGAQSGTDRSILERKASRSPNRWVNFLTHSFAIVRFPQIKHGTNGNDAGRINFGVRHVVMALDVIEVDRVGDARLLI